MSSGYRSTAPPSTGLQRALLTDLRGKRIGSGPNGSGTAHLVRQVFALPHSRSACQLEAIID